MNRNASTVARLLQRTATTADSPRGRHAAAHGRYGGCSMNARCWCLLNVTTFLCGLSMALQIYAAVKDPPARQPIYLLHDAVSLRCLPSDADRATIAPSPFPEE